MSDFFYEKMNDIFKRYCNDFFVVQKTCLEKRKIFIKKTFNNECSHHGLNLNTLEKLIKNELDSK